MKALIKDLKKYDAFRFNHEILVVSKRYVNENSSLITTSGEVFYCDGLEVDKVDKKALGV